MILSGTSDILRVVTGSAVTVDAQVSWSDQTTSAFTPGRTNTAITTATTTTILGSPAASTQRIVQSLKVRNKHASSSNLITLEHFDGTTAVEVVKYTLLAGELLQYDGREFTLFDANGAIKTSGGGGAADGLNRIAAGTQTAGTLATVVFSNSNGISFGMSNSSIVTASYTVPTETPFGVSAGTQSVSTGTLVFSNSNNVTFGMSGSSRVTASASFAAETPFGISAGTQSVSTGTMIFSDSNGISFGMSGSSRITASYTVPTETPFGISAGTQSVSTGTMIFSNSNNVSFGMSGSSRITASASFAAETPFGISAGTQSVSTGTMIFSDSNGISFGMSGSSRITASYTVPTETPFGVSAGTQSVSTGTLIFSNSNNVSFGMSGSSRVTASASFAAETPFGISAGTQSVSTGTMVFSDSNGISFGMSGSSRITASYTVPTQTNQQMTMFATGNTTLSSTGTTNASSLIFRGSGAASIGITNGSILIDVAAGAAAITQSIGMSTQTAGGATGGTTGYATGDDILYHFVPGSNITMSQSINGASGTLSIYGNSTAALVTLSGWDPFAHHVGAFQGIANATLFLQQLDLPIAVQFDRVGLRITHSNASNSSGSATISAWLGVYTRNASTLSLVTSTSFSTAITQSGTVGSYSNYGGVRILGIPFTTTLSVSNYWLGIVSRTTTGGANMTFGYAYPSGQNSSNSGYFGSGSNVTAHSKFGQGAYSATTAGMPNSIAFTQINAHSTDQYRVPMHILMSNIF